MNKALTELTLIDIQQVIHLCVSECYLVLRQSYVEFT